jgi:iron complex transport system substrate-binding protein
MPEPRIISLLPSATEIVYAFGLQDRLVGRSHECDFPPEVQALPICSQPKYQSYGSSADINTAVETILREALSIYRVDVERIEALEPTHIITQSQCAVCAVSTDELRAALRESLHVEAIHLIDLNPESLDQVWGSILLAADSLDVHRKGEELVNTMRAGFEAVRATAQAAPAKPRIAYLEWIEPIMVAGHWIRSLIELAGGQNVFPDKDQRWMSFEQLVEQNPDKIVIAPCGFSIQRSMKDMSVLQHKPEWKTLKAVQNHEVYVCDGNHYFNRPGPRLVESLEILAEIFQPGLFPAQHHESGWIKFESAGRGPVG